MRARLLVTLAAAALYGCPDDGLLGNGRDDPNGRLDAGFVRVGVDSGAGLDAGPSRDAAAPERCVCPTLPSVCRPPPVNDPVFTPGGTGMRQQLFDVLACADQRIQLAMYETTWTCVVDALSARLAADPDLEVDVVIDDDRCPRSAADGRLECELSRVDGHPRVHIVEDGRSRLMHHKFLIADGSRVWVSSGNFTRVSLCFDHNNALIIDEPAIVAGYREEFDRLFTANEFGPIDPMTSPPAAGGPFTLYRSPETPITRAPRWFEAMLGAVRTASVSVDVMINAWTRVEVAEALLEAHGRGVTVRVLVESAYSDDPPAASVLAAGIPLKTGQFHDKMMIVDGRLVITGSPNWSEAAWQNNEGSLWIDDAAIAAIYAEEFEQQFAEASRR